MHFRQFGIKLWLCGYVSLDKWHCKPGDWDASAMWLGHTDLSMEDIAEGCGYADRFTFSKVFVKHMGLSPAKYRREYRFADSGRPQALMKTLL